MRSPHLPAALVAVSAVVSLVGVLLAQDPPAPPQPTLNLKGHTDPVYTVAVSPDGKTIATGSFDKSVKLWDAATGKEVRTFAGKAGHQNLVTCVAFSPDGTQLASASTDTTVKVWDVPTGKPQAELAHAAAATCVAATVDGKLVAAGAADGSVRVWTAIDNKLMQTLAPAGTGAAVGVAFSANGATLYTLAADRVLRYWTVADGKPVGAVGASTADVNALWVNPGGGQVAVGGVDGTVRFFPATLAVPAKALPASATANTAFALSADGTFAVDGSDDKKVRVVNAGTAAAVFALDLPAAPVLAAANANGSQFAVVTADNRLTLIGGDGKPRGTYLAHDSGVLGVAFHPTQPLLMTLGKDGTSKTWALPAAAPVPIKPLVHPDAVTAVSLTADGKKVLTGSNDKVARVWANGAVEKEFKGHTAAVSTVTVAADWVLSADAAGDALFWTPADGKQVGKLAGPKKAIVAVAVPPGAKTAAAVYADGEVRYWPLPTTAEKDAKVLPHPKPVIAAAFAADAKRLITVCTDGKVRTWTPDTAKEESSFATATLNPLAAAVSADRTKLAEVGTVGTARALVVRPLAANAKPVFSVPLADDVESLAFSGDGLKLAVATKTATARRVRVFDAAGNELQTVAETTAAVRALAFMPDGKTLLIGGDDKQMSAVDLLVTATRSTAGGSTAGMIFPSTGAVLVGSPDKAVRIWEGAAGLVGTVPKEVKAFPALPAAATCVAFSRDGALAVAGSGKVLKAWQIADGKEVPLAAPPAEVVRVAVSADRTRIAAALASNVAVVYSAATGQVEQFVPHAGVITGLEFHPTQPLLFTASADKSVLATPLVAPRVVADPVRFGAALTGTSNGSHTLSTGTGKGVILANAATGATERTFGDMTGVTVVAADKANQQVAAYTPAAQTVSVYNFADGAPLGDFKPPAAVVALAYHPTQSALVGVLADRRVVAWNIRTEPGQPLPPEFGKVGSEYPHPAGVKAVAFVADTALAAAGEDKVVRVWKFAADVPTRSLQHPNLVNSAAFDKTGTLIATGGQDGVLRIWDVSKPAVPAAREIKAHVQAMPTAQAFPIYAVLWTPDAKRLVTAADDRSIKIWDAAAGTLVKEIKPGPDRPPVPPEVRDAAPGAVGSAAGVVLNTPPPPGHTDQVYALALSPDGTLLASGSADRTVRLWNAATGAPVRTLSNPALPATGDGGPPPSHPGFVQGLRFTADGAKLVSVGTAPRGRGAVSVWAVADGKLLAAHELSCGGVYAVDVLKDGSAVLGCGPRARGQPDGDAVVLPLK